MNQIEHEETKKKLKELSKEFFKLCEESSIPMFLAYCTQESGYQYKCLLPGEFPGKKELGDNEDKFIRFLRVVSNFDKEKFRIKINEANGNSVVEE